MSDDPARFKRLLEMIEEALDRPAGERDAFLEEQCAGDAALLEQARGMLSVDDQEDSILDHPALEETQRAEDSDGEAWQSFLKEVSQPKETWERYDQEGEIGRGGMGVVFRVHDKHLRRQLAMKLLVSSEERAPGSRRSYDSASLGRFVEEAQVTSQLDHPGVVPVHEVGLDPEERIYFTMKLVKGKDLREIFDMVKDGEEGWNPTRALNVLLRVCDAVAYAHAKGVIHRDLKPANIMVGRFGETYVMDWGLARVEGRTDRRDLRLKMKNLSVATLVETDRKDLREEAPDSALQTMDGEVVGTPIYMPPEQADGRHVDLGPTADVYAMGAILYQLLTGQMPYVPAGTQPSPYTVLRWVLEGPPKPVSELNKNLPPEMVAICEKAMSRNPAQRYQTMVELGDDLRAYLERRVVKAYARGPVAELRKWVARNKAQAVSLAAILLLAASAGFLLAWQHRSTAAAVAKERDAAQAVAGFQKEVLTIDPWELGPAATPLDVVDRAAARARVAFEGKPEIEASVLAAVGDTYSSFGAYRQAAEQYERAVEIRHQVSGPDDPESTGANQALAKVYLELGRISEAVVIQQRILELRRDKRGENDPLTLSSMLDLADAERQLLHYEEALVLLKQVVEARTAALGTNHPETLAARRRYASTLAALDRDDEAEALYRQILETDGIDEKLRLECRSGIASILIAREQKEEGLALQREIHEAYRTRLGELHPDTLNARDSLAGTLFSMSKYEEVLEMDRQVLNRRKEVLGENHPDTLISRMYEAYDLAVLKKHDEALALGRPVRRDVEKILGPTHPTTSEVKLLFIRLLRTCGEYDEGLDAARSLTEDYRETLGKSHSRTLSVLKEQATLLDRKKQYEDSLPIWREIAEVRRGELGADHPDSINSLREVASTLVALGRYEESEALEAEVFERNRTVFGEEHRRTLRAMENLALTERSLKKHDQSLARLETLWELRRDTLGETDDGTRRTREVIATGLRMAGRLDEARAEWEQLIAAYSEQEGAESSLTVRALIAMNKTLTELGDWATVEKNDRQVLAYMRKEWGDEHQETMQAMRNLGSSLKRLKRYDEAQELLLEVVANESQPVEAWKARDEIASLLENQGRHAESLPIRRQILAYEERESGLDQISCIQAIFDLGSTYSRLDRWPESVEQRSRGIDLLLLLKENDKDDNYWEARAVLGESLAMAGRLEESEQVLREARTELSRLLGELDEITLDCAIELAITLGKRERYDEAETILRAILAAPENETDDRSRDRARTRLADLLVTRGMAAEAEALLRPHVESRRSEYMWYDVRLARALLAQQRFDAAEDHLLRAEGQLSLSNLSGKRTLYRLMVELYETWGRPEEGAEYRDFLDNEDRGPK